MQFQARKYKTVKDSALAYYVRAYFFILEITFGGTGKTKTFEILVFLVGLGILRIWISSDVFLP